MDREAVGGGLGGLPIKSGLGPIGRRRAGKFGDRFGLNRHGVGALLRLLRRALCQSNAA